MKVANPHSDAVYNTASLPSAPVVPVTLFFPLAIVPLYPDFILVIVPLSTFNVTFFPIIGFPLKSIKLTSTLISVASIFTL